MTTALPAATTAVASGATQGDVKNWITGVHDYLAGLFGTTGSTADALTALGVGGGVSSAVAGNGVAVSGATGAVTFSVSAPSANSVGSYCFASIQVYQANWTFGGNYSAGIGSQQIQLWANADSVTGGTLTGSISGTWKWMGLGTNSSAGGQASSAFGIAVRVA